MVQWSPAPDLKTLSSKLPSGDAGHVALSTTGGVSVSVDAVSSVSVPGGDTTPTTWTPTYSLSGSHTVAETGLSSPLASPGSSVVTVDLVGTKGGSDTFTQGSYQATVTVRCE